MSKALTFAYSAYSRMAKRAARDFTEVGLESEPKTSFVQEMSQILVLRKLAQLKHITNVGLGVEPPAARRSWDLGSKPHPLVEFCNFSKKKQPFKRYLDHVALFFVPFGTT